MISIELFSHNSTIVNIAAEKPLFSQGEAGHLMFVLKSGEADVFVNGRLVESLEHGSIVGEMGLVSPGPRSATIVARTDCEFVAVDENRFQFLVQQTPFFATQVMRVMAERLRNLDRMVTSVENN